MRTLMDHQEDEQPYAAKYLRIREVVLPVVQGDVCMPKRMALVALLVIVMCGRVWAGTVTGVTGLINIPTTAALSSGLMEASIHTSGGEAIASITIAVAPQVEVGVYTTNRYGPLNITVKGVVVQQDEDMPGIAVGLDGTSTYIVMSRNLQTAHGYLGVGGRYGGIFGGLTMELQRSEKQAQYPVTTLIMEHDGRSVNFGIRASFPKGIYLDVALINIENLMLGITLQTGF